ncbi:MAG: hypothetical protein SFW35_13765 [Chitinophagales bacterium]|nr:hypothetical protein [Chitinophagales bacterium]
MYSIKPAKADTTANPTPWDDVLRGGVGLGIVKDTAYFVVFTSQGNKFYKAPTDKAVSWYED